jgi:hypothetical protein
MGPKKQKQYKKILNKFSKILQKGSKIIIKKKKKKNIKYCYIGTGSA